MIITSVMLGLLMFVLSVWLNLQVMKKARSVPPYEAPKYMVAGYVIKIAVFTLFLGGLAYWVGSKFILWVLGGMVLGMLLFLVVSRSNRAFFERFVK